MSELLSVQLAKQITADLKDKKPSTSIRYGLIYNLDRKWLTIDERSLLIWALEDFVARYGERKNTDTEGRPSVPV